MKFAKLFYDTLSHYKIVDCIHAITADKALVNGTMAHELEYQIPHFKSATNLLGCVAHFINLAAKIGISALGSLDKQNKEGKEISMATADSKPLPILYLSSV